MSLPRILLYATASCPHCEAARAAIRESGEAWEERDPTASEERLRELLMVAASATVPTIVIGNRALVGFDRDRFGQMLRMPAFEPPVREPETPEELPEADPILPGRRIDGGGCTSPEE
jgi:glutaredoxin